jgi:hypothetical protein
MRHFASAAFHQLLLTPHSSTCQPAAANSNPATSPNLKGQADDIAPFFEMLSEGFA